MTIGSTFNPGLSSVYNLSMVPEEPPAPADLVDDGRAFLRVSLWSAAARLRMADRGPPGGEPALAIEEPLDLTAEGVELSGPDSGPEVIGEAGLGAAYNRKLGQPLLHSRYIWPYLRSITSSLLKLFLIRSCTFVHTIV